MFLLKAKNILYVITGMLFTLLPLTGCGDSGSSDPSQAKHLIVGTSADNPPFEFHSTSHNSPQVQGYDVDYINLLAKKMGMTVEVKDMDFNALIPALHSGRIHIIMAAMTPTPERQKNVGFSKIYFKAQEAVLIKKPSESKDFLDENFLAGKKIGVQLGSAHEVLLKEIAKRVSGIHIITLNRLGDLVQELHAGRIDAVLTELVVAKAYAAASTGIEALLLQGHAMEFAIAVQKDSPLVDKLNAAIHALENTPEIEFLYQKWFPVL